MKITLGILKTLPSKIEKILWFLGLHAFLLILLLILVDLAIGGVVFYKYVYLAEIKEPATANNVLKFDSKTYQDVLKELR